MTSTPAVPPSFPKARAGYDRSSVDAYVRRLSAQLADLTKEHATQVEELESMRTSLAELRTAHDRLASATVEERAQDVLDSAAQEAATVLAQAQQRVQSLEAEARRRIGVLEERARQELAWRRRQLQAERTELTAQKQAMRRELASLRALAGDAASIPQDRPSLPADVPSAPQPPSDRSPDGAPSSPAAVSEQHR